MHYLSICCVAKDEDRYLAEWVRYHRLVGVERIYLYDNESAVPISQTLRPFVDEGFVSVTNVKGTPVQRGVYQHFIKARKNDSHWAAVIDVDEFIVPRRHNDVRTLLQNYEQFGALGVHWLMFGSSGHVTAPAGLTIESYTRRSAKSAKVNTHIKSIIQPAKTADTGTNAHYFNYHPPHVCVNEMGQPVVAALSPHTSNLIQLNHYCLRSREEFYNWKSVRGDVDSGGDYDRTTFARHDAYSNVEVDTEILRFLPFLK